MIGLLAMMTAISATTRLIPFLFSKWLLQWTALEKLSATLPMSISILLVAHLLDQTPFSSYPFGIPELAGLLAVISIHVWRRNILISMGTGICIHQLLLYFL